MSAPLLNGADYTDATGSTVSDTALAMASGLVRDYCGWSISEETDTLTLDSDGGIYLFLPSLLVTTVTSVILNGVDAAGQPMPTLLATDWDWRTNGQLTWLKDDCGWPSGGQRVTVAYTHGYTVVPDGVQAAVVSAAERIAVSSAYQQQLENVGGIQTNHTFSAATTAGVGLTDIEKASLSRYQIRVLS